MKISDNAAQALYGATVTKGKNKGLLLKTAPRDRLARAAWYGAQSVCNPYKLSIYWLMTCADDERAIYREIETFMEQWKAATKGAAVLIDQDRRTLEGLGAW